MTIFTEPDTYLAILHLFLTMISEITKVFMQWLSGASIKPYFGHLV